MRKLRNTADGPRGVYNRAGILETFEPGEVREVDVDGRMALASYFEDVQDKPKPKGKAD